jgi:tetratricopeptide (TPR) repeat protein
MRSPNFRNYALWLDPWRFWPGPKRSPPLQSVLHRVTIRVEFSTTTHYPHGRNMNHGFLVRWLPMLLFAGCASFEIGGEIQSGRMALIRGEPVAALTHFERVAKADPGYVTDFSPLQESVWTYVGRARYAAGKWPEAREAFERALAHLQTDSMAKLYLGLTLIRQTQGRTVKPLSLDDVVYALREGVEPKRVAVLIREQCIEFDMAAETETILKKAGADPQLIEEIRKARVATAKLRRGNELHRDGALKETALAMQELHQWLERVSGDPFHGKYWDPARAIRSRIESTVALISAKDRDWQKIVAGGEWVGEKLEEEIDLVRRERQRDSMIPRRR